MQRDLFESPDEGSPSRTPRPLSTLQHAAVDFQVSLTPKVAATDRIKQAFATAIRNHERARTRLSYLEQLSIIAHSIIQQIIQPVETSYSDGVVAQVHFLINWFDHPPQKLTKRRRERLQQILTDTLHRVVFELDRSELKPLLEKYGPPASAEDDAGAREVVADFFESMTGVKMDPRDFEGDMGPEHQARLDAKYGSQFRGAPPGTGGMPAGTDGAADRTPRRKSRHQLKKEAAAKEAQELLDRDITRLFKDLVVQLHPDREQDQTRRLEKEELMKILTRARDENDYSELLRLHVLVNDWNGNTDRPAISEQTLKTLTGLLRAKTQTLEFEGRNLVRNDFLMHRLREIAYREEIDRAALTHAARVHANQVRSEVENEKREFAELSADPRKFFLWLDRQKIEAPDEIDLLDAILGRQF